MKTKLLTILAAVLMTLNVVWVSAAQQNKVEHVIADFEGGNPVAASHTTHPANVTVVSGAPEGGGRSALQTVVDTAAGAGGYFGTGFRFPAMDLSGAAEIQLWIKTDIKSDFMLQFHTDGNRASAFRFSTVGSKLGAWTKITAPVASFIVPQWSRGKVDWTRVTKCQVTAFGAGPYNGKRITVDHVVGFAQASSPASPKNVTEGPVNRGGPIEIDGVDSSSKIKSPPAGFRSLFDGKTLNGWTAKARLPVPRFPGAPFNGLQGERLEAASANTGLWTIEDGAIVGGQDPPGSGKGAYLVSNETFGDFELIMDMKPDWKTDSGFLVRTQPGGSPGMQVLVDHRPQGGIGGFYGNGLAGVHGMPFAIDAEYDKQGNPVRMIAADPEGERVELNPKTRDILTYAADVDDFLKIWKWGQWNTVKVRCEGRIPKLTTWANGLKISVLDMNAIEWENYDPEACAKLMGGKGHISLEVHNNNFNHWLGKDRWWPGAVVRWKNIFIRELD
jgi:hypothetical protein